MKKKLLIHLINGDIIESYLLIEDDLSNSKRIRHIIEREMYKIGNEGYFSMKGESLFFYPPQEIQFIEATKLNQIMDSRPI